VLGPRLVRVPLDDGIDPYPGTLGGTVARIRFDGRLDEYGMLRTARQPSFHGPADAPLEPLLRNLAAVRAAELGQMVDPRLVRKRPYQGLVQ